MGYNDLHKLFLVGSRRKIAKPMRKKKKNNKIVEKAQPEEHRALRNLAQEIAIFIIVVGYASNSICPMRYEVATKTTIYSHIYVYNL